MSPLVHNIKQTKYLHQVHVCVPIVLFLHMNLLLQSARLIALILTCLLNRTPRILCAQWLSSSGAGARQKKMRE
jgi:hypothetical protein